VNWQGLGQWQEWVLAIGGSLAAALIGWFCKRFFWPKQKSQKLVVTFCAFSAALVIGRVYVVNPPPMHQEDKINNLAFNSSSHLLASASEDKTVVLWDVAKQRKIRTLAGHIGAVTCVAFSSNGLWLASGSADNTIKVWSVETGHPAYTLNDSKVIEAVALSPDGCWLASTTDESIKLWDVTTSRVAHVVWHNDIVEALALSADGRLLASGSADKTVKVWNVETGQLVGGPLHHDDEVEALAFSLDGRLLASGSFDKTIKLWQVGTWRIVNTLWHQARLSTVAFNLEGTELLSVGENGGVKLWEAPTWRELRGWIANERNTASTWAFSPDGLTLATGTTDGAIKLQPLREFNTRQ